MVRVISPKGKLLHVNQVQPVCEKQISFNGRRIVIMERAKDLSVKPTALAMQIEESGSNSGWNFNQELQVGNLKPEKVLEIIHAMGEKEYYDFSVLSYQDTKDFEKVVLDNGESAAYSNCIQNVCGVGNFCDNDSWNDRPVFPMDMPEGCKIMDNSEDSCDEDKGWSDEDEGWFDEGR